MSPAGDNNDIVSSSDEITLLTKVNRVLDSSIHVIHPGSSRSVLLIEEWNTSSEHLELSRHLGEPGDGEDGTVGLVLADDVGGGPGGGQHHDGGGLDL